MVARRLGVLVSTYPFNGRVMNTSCLGSTLITLFGELVDGATESGAYTLNSGDQGLLASLDRLSAAQASAVVDGGSSIAAQVDHLRYSLSLINRWEDGISPYVGADWSESWRRTAVNDDEWQRLRSELGEQAHRWLEKLATPREVSQREMSGIVSSIAHLAYHMGAIRQMNRSTRGPAATDD